MKKIILLILLIPNMVLASTIYTEYEPFLLNTNEYIEETDILKREEEKLYNTYQEEIVEEKYMQLNTSNEYKIDYEDYFYEYQYSLEPTEYVYEYNTKCENRNYLPRYMELLEFSDNFKLNKSEIITTELREYNITYTPNMLDIDNIQEITTNSSIYFNFFKNINILDFKMKLYLPKQDLENLNLKIIFYPYEFTSEFSLLPNKDNIITIHFDNDYNKFLKENNFTTTNKCISYYSSRIPFYKHYKINKKILNKYIPLNNDDLFILEDYKTNYNYYKREKIEITDSIILKNSIFDLNNYILSSTIPLEDLKVVDNINYEQEGIYNLNIYYKDQLITSKNVEYNKEANVEMAKTECNKQIINQEKKLTTTTKPIKVTTKKSSTSKTQTTKVITTKKTKVTTNVKKLNKKIVINVKENKYQNQVIISVIGGLLLILIIFECILLYVKKKYY